MPKVKLPLRKIVQISQNSQDKLKNLQKNNPNFLNSNPKTDLISNSDLPVNPPENQEDLQNPTENSVQKPDNSNMKPDITNSDQNSNQNLQNPAETNFEAKENLEIQQSVEKLEISQTNSDKVVLEILQKELEDWKSRALRLTADLTNSGKQEEINLAQTRKNSKKSVVNLLLPFLNTLYLSFAFVPIITDEKVQKFVQTLQNSFQSLIKDLSINGIEILIPDKNSTFDPITMTALNSPTDENISIKQVVSVGLKIDNQLIRPASVML